MNSSTLVRILLLGPILGLSYLPADVVRLKNGSKIRGTVLEGEAGGGSKVVVEIDGQGKVFLRGHDVIAIESGDGLTGVRGGDYLAVTLNSSGDFYGKGTYYGQESNQSDDGTLVLSVPDAGLIRIPRGSIATTRRIAKAETTEADGPSSTEAAEAATSIPTTHKLHLRNGRTLQGDLLDEADNGAIRVRVGNLGVMTFPKREVLRVEEVEGSYELPAPAGEGDAAEPMEVEPEGEDTLPEDAYQRLKREVRNEILRELLDAAVEEKLGGLAPAASTSEQLDLALTADLDREEILEIQALVYDLGRDRTTNRTRAERKLKEMGAIVLPYLKPLINHPADLTRRAVQRIVRDLRDVRGTPLAIEAMNDPDTFVRKFAGEALRVLIPNPPVAYHDNAPPRRRQASQHAYREYWGQLIQELALAD